MLAHYIADVAMICLGPFEDEAKQQSRCKLRIGDGQVPRSFGAVHGEDSHLVVPEAPHSLRNTVTGDSSRRPPP